jgi:carotenoid cleavage dioxygenase-like enzyme
MVVIPRSMSHHTEYRSFDVTPCHIFHFGTSREILPEGLAMEVSSSSNAGNEEVGHGFERVRAVEFSAVCLPKAFAMFPVEHGAFLSNAETAPAKLCYFKLVFGQENIAVTALELDSSSCEFPSTHPLTHGRGSRYTWMMANARGKGLPFRDVVKVDEKAALEAAEAKEKRERELKDAKGAAAQLASAAAAVSSAASAASSLLLSATSPPPAVTSTHKVFYSPGIVGEPIFIPRRWGIPLSDGEEDDGWIFVQTYIPEMHKTDFMILDAREPQKGPLATIHLKHHVPYGFHGQSVEQAGE